MWVRYWGSAGGSSGFRVWGLGFGLGLRFRVWVLEFGFGFKVLGFGLVGCLLLKVTVLNEALLRDHYLIAPSMWPYYFLW